METHLRRITQCLGRAIEELERVSASEKAANEVDAAWLARFHAAVDVPLPVVTEMSVATDDVLTPGHNPEYTCTADVQPSTVVTQNSREDAAAQCISDAGIDYRWKYLETIWLPLLNDLHRTLGILDREESALQEAEARAAAGNSGRDATSKSAASRRRNEAPPRPPKGLLSLRDYTVVHSALELVVHWGMCPRLESGVGVFDADRRPRSRAVKLSRRVLNVCAASQRDAVGVGVERAADTRDGSDAVVDYSSAEQLASCTNAIQGIVFTPQFIPMLMPLYLPDLLAAKLQLAYRRYPTKATITTAVEATAATLKSPVAETSKGRRADEEKSLQALLRAVGPRQVMSASRQLLSQGAKVPLWLKQRAGGILSQIVLRPGGVQATLEVYLAGIGGESATGAGTGASGDDAAGEEMKALLRVARLLAVPPKRVSSVEYVAHVAPQLTEMLHYDGQQRAVVTRVVVMIIGKLCESMPAQTTRLILCPLCRPLALFWGRGKSLQRSRASSRPSSKSIPVILSGSIGKTGSPGSGAGNSTTEGFAAGAADGQNAEVADSSGSAGIGSRVLREANVVEGSRVTAPLVKATAVELASEKVIGGCVEDLEKLLTAAPAPPVLLASLSKMGVAVPLFRLHCSCKTSKLRDLQSTQQSLTALLSALPPSVAARDLVAGLLPAKTGWAPEEPRFCPGPTGGAVLKAPRSQGLKTAELDSHVAGTGDTRQASSASNGSLGTKDVSPPLDKSLLELEQALQGLGLDPETLRLVENAAGAIGEGEGNGLGGIKNGGLMNTLVVLRAAESRARYAADLLEGLGEESVVPGQVFELLLRRYLSLRETLTATKSGNGGEDGESSSATGSGFLAAASESAVMAGVVVLAERLGGRLFGSGKQVLSCIRLVLEHEMPRYGSGLRERGFDGSMGADLDSGNSLSGCGQRDDGEDGGFGSADAAARIARMEADEAQEDEGAGGTGLELGLGSRFGSEGEDIRAVPGNSDTGDTLCSVVLGLLTTVLELGEEKRPAEEEQELQAMIPSLQMLAARHRSAEVSEMSAMLSASILSRRLTPEQRQQERSRAKVVVYGSRDISESSRREQMLEALRAAEEDLESDSPPMRARGVVTLTRLMRATSEGGQRDAYGRTDGRERAHAPAADKMDKVVAERLLDTYARMAGDRDSYVYLAAVQGLAALADALPAWCIPRLVGLFAALPHPSVASPEAQGSSEFAGKRRSSPGISDYVDLPLSQRLKIGEAVVLSARRRGEAMPAYAHYYVNAFVCAARERSGVSAPTISSSLQHGHRKSPPSSTLHSGLENDVAAAANARALLGNSLPPASRTAESRGGSSLPVKSLQKTQRRVIGHEAQDATVAGSTPADDGGGDIHDKEAREGGVRRTATKTTQQAVEAGDSLESRERSHFRASCLSNLAEVCQLLRWSLGRFSQDVIDLGAGVLSMETGDSEEPRLARRGAAFLLSRILRGAGGDVLQMVPPDQLRTAYRALKRAAEVDRDEAARSHARAGLRDLDVAIRGQFFQGRGSSGGRDSVLGVTSGSEDGVFEEGMGGDGQECSNAEGSASSSRHPGITVL